MELPPPVRPPTSPRPGAVADDPRPSRSTDAADDAPRRRHLDGLRAVAVALVLAFHTDVDRLSGGFVGVDVFFVLSGYLVTEVLLRDVRAGRPIRFGRFYSRRVRRLLPAAIVTILVVGAVFSSIGDTLDRDALADAMRSCLLYVGNWHFIATGADYFLADRPSPLLHLWSLAVEEQFYLVWPLLLAVTLGAFRRWWVVRTLVVLGALASLGAALALQGGHLDRAYFGTGTRVYQLLAGAALALTPAVVARVAARPRLAGGLALAGLGGIVVVATSLVAVGPITRGALVTVAALAALVGLDAAPHGRAARALSLALLVRLGEISYGIYLWHWPVALGIDDLADVSDGSRVALTAGLSVGLAAASALLLEVPSRRARLGDALRWPVVGAGVAASVLAATVAVPWVTDPGAADAEAVAVEVRSGTPVPSPATLTAIRAEHYAEHRSCIGLPVERCTLVRGSGPHVLLVGDSMAESLTLAFMAMAEEHDLTFSVSAWAGCPWQRGILIMGPEFKGPCRTQQADLYDRVLPALDPDIVVVASIPLVAGDYTTWPRDDLIRRSRASVTALQGGHRQVVAVEGLPRQQDDAEVDPLGCMARARFAEECRFIATDVDRWYRDEIHLMADDDPLLATVDLRRLVCPYDPICDPILDGQVVWWDPQHITQERSRSLGPGLGQIFVRAGLIPP